MTELRRRGRQAGDAGPRCDGPGRGGQRRGGARPATAAPTPARRWRSTRCADRAAGGGRCGGVQRRDGSRGRGAGRRRPPTTPASPRCASCRPTRRSSSPTGRAPCSDRSPLARVRETEFRSGFVCFVGRPNTGKSTLTNALVGAKVAITSNRPQTTRHTIRGIVHREDFQIILVDTPGLHRPRTLLGKRLNDLVTRHLLRGRRHRAVHPGRREDRPRRPVDLRADPRDRAEDHAGRRSSPRSTRCPRRRVAAQLLAVSELVGPDAEIVPVSATTGEQLDVLIDVLAAQLPPGPAFYPDGELTDEPEEVLMAELIREAALEGVRDELPHSLAVVIEEVSPREGRDDLHRRARHPLRRTGQPEGHRHRQGRRQAARGRHRRAHPDREAARHQGVPRPARQDRQELAARPETAWAAGVLSACAKRIQPR